MRGYLAQPEWLWLLAVLPPAAVRAAVGRARRRRDWAALGQGGRVPGDGSLGWLAAAACLIVALAQPRWGRSEMQPLPPGHDVVIAVDVSRSMGVEDAVPDRLGVAVDAARGLVDALGAGRDDRVAVVAFAGRAVQKCPLTSNLGAVSASLSSLRPGDLRPGGTDLGAALDAALDAFDDHDHADGRTVVLFSDGEDHTGSWRQAAERLREAGVIVHTVAVGDADQGHPVPSRRAPGSRSTTAAGTARESPEENAPGPLRFRGKVVLSKRDDRPLEAIAGATAGAFLPLGLSAIDLGPLYRSRIEPAARARRDDRLAPEPVERFGLFLLAGLGFGLASRGGGRNLGRVLLGRSLSVAVLVLSLALALGSGLGAAGPEGVPTGLVSRGQAAYREGRFGDALEAFEEAATLAPAEPVARFDVAATLFQLGRFEEALAWYADARGRAGPALRTRIDFALGHTSLALGDLSGSLAHFQDCVRSTARGADLDEIRRRAAVNRRFVEELARPSPSASEEPEAKAKARAKPKDRPPEGPRGDRDATPPGANGSDAGGSGPPPAGEPNPPPSGRRGPGGAGGSGPAPPGPESPEDRLSRAVGHVREAQRRRIEEPPKVDDSRDLKVW